MNYEAIIIGRIKNCGGGFIKFFNWENRKGTVQGLSFSTILKFLVMWNVSSPWILSSPAKWRAPLCR